VVVVGDEVVTDVAAVVVVTLGLVVVVPGRPEDEVVVVPGRPEDEVVVVVCAPVGGD
jgi:predicted HAD superfamily phosphohydrolase YqeG